MTEIYQIAGYCRISVDEEIDRDNTSIENQKAIIQAFVQNKFPTSHLTFYEDRDRSGYTFEQRESYQSMRRELIAHRRQILVVKDFSRFSRRNSRGLVELEDLRDSGVRIISIGDNIDFPNDDDWLKIQFQFLINEMPVTDTSKKVRSVIKRRQSEGKWICAVPYGYSLNRQQEFEIIPEEAAVIQKIFDLYTQDGWGYKRIADYLTDQGIPTPRMAERIRKEAAGETCRRKAGTQWSILTVQGILDNDFYIGTLRQGKYTRQKINGRDTLQDPAQQIVIENHHAPILDRRTFLVTRELREKRTRSHYRGVKKNDNTYSGFLTCGDCGSPMFATSRKDLKPAYTCGSYHRRGRKGCTSHHIRADVLDALLKDYLQKVMENSADMLERLNRDLEGQPQGQDLPCADSPAKVLEDLQQELKITKRQRIRDIMKHPDQEATLEETYDALEQDLQKRMEGLRRQKEILADRRSAIVRVRHTAKNAMEVFGDILEKPHLDRNDLELIIREIRVFEDHMEIRLQSDLDAILRSGVPEDSKSLCTALTQSADRHADRHYHVRVISEGDPLEIYTEKDGSVIFRKYSPMGDLQDSAAKLCQALNACIKLPAAVADQDSILATAGARNLAEKPASQELETLMQQKKPYLYTAGQRPIQAVTGESRSQIGAAVPILNQGDLLGCVMLLMQEDEAFPPPDLQLLQVAAEYLARQVDL